MQIVIDIPEEIYNEIKSMPYHTIIESYILNGIPLPKGHGDLIDRKDLIESILCKTFGLRSIDIENAPTIIKADNAESEDKE